PPAGHVAAGDVCSGRGQRRLPYVVLQSAHGQDAEPAQALGRLCVHDLADAPPEQGLTDGRGERNVARIEIDERAGHQGEDVAFAVIQVLDRYDGAEARAGRTERVIGDVVPRG